MDVVARRRMLREASAGLDALNAWIEDAFRRADEVEADDELQALTLRSAATKLYEALTPVTADVAGELFTSMAPEFGALLDPVPSV